MRRLFKPCRLPAGTVADLYDPAFVKGLFDEMAGTYGTVNLLSSFGFCVLWRRQCLNLVDWRPDDVTIDLMAGMAELLPGILKRTSPDAVVTAIDLSTRMCELANAHVRRRRAPRAAVLQADVLLLDRQVPNDSADVVVSSFGLKTFSEQQIRELATQVHRILRPGGRFALLEISVPPSALLRMPYLFYLRHIIPPIGKIFLGNPDNYRMLEIYTTAFGNCSQAKNAFEATGLVTQMSRFFFGCATAIHGTKPAG